MKRYFAFIAIALLSLFLFGCDLFSPTKKTTMEVTVNHAIASENAVVSEELTSNIASISEDKNVIVLSTNAEALGIKEDKIIVVGVTDKTPNGLLKKVTNVSTQAGASTLSLEQASLTEALSEANIMISRNLEANGETYSSNKSISVRPNPRASKSNLNIEIPIEEYVLYDADGNSATTNDQIVLNGSLELGLSISMHIKISNGELKKFEFVSKPSITSKISISSSISLGSIDIKKNLIEPVHLKPIVSLVATPLGPFPIVIVPVLKLDAILSGSASIGVSSDVTTTLEQQAGAVYEDGHWAPVNNHTEQFDFSQPSLSGNCKLDLSVGPSLDFLLYDVVGPYFEVKGKTSFFIDTGSSSWWTLSAGLYSKIGFNMEIFDVATLNYDLVLFDFSKVLASSAGKQFTITYNGNGNTGGSVPIDNNLYAEGESATVLGPANLEKTGCQFVCWNTKQDGSGTNYYAGDKIKIEKQNVTLYADWTIAGFYLFATGYNDCGQLGDGTTIDKSTPVKVMENVQSVSAGGCHTMILKNDGSLWATGANWYGQLGDGTTIDKLTPVKVMQNVQSISAGGCHTMILKNDGSLWATGLNYNGQLGDGTTIDKLTPVKVMENVQSVSSGYDYTMILKKDSSLWATGHNDYGQLGDGTTIDKSTPVKVMENVQSVSAGYWHTMILKNDASLWATGLNDYGALGDGTTIDKSTPVKVMENVQSVSAGEWYTMILKNGGSLWAIGYNHNGELGDGTIIERWTPVKVMDNVQSVSAGNHHTMILKNDGSLWATGYNGCGQLGDGTTIDKSTPVKVMQNVQSVSAGGLDTMIIVY